MSEEEGYTDTDSVRPSGGGGRLVTTGKGAVSGVQMHMRQVSIVHTYLIIYTLGYCIFTLTLYLIHKIHSSTHINLYTLVFMCVYLCYTTGAPPLVLQLRIQGGRGEALQRRLDVCSILIVLH